MEFDPTGEHLASGDQGGRVVLFSRAKAGEDNRCRPRHPYVYKYQAEFQSHEPEFDYLKSLDIEEKINKIRWVTSSNGSKLILSTNDKTIKLWKVYEHRAWHVATARPLNGGSPAGQRAAGAAGAGTPGGTNSALDGGLAAAGANGGGQPASQGVLTSASQLKLPKVLRGEPKLTARCRRVYSDAHAYHINSVSTNSDGQTYLSADDLRINVWSLDVAAESFNIVDLKPNNMEDLTEVITAAEFHPTHCNMFAYSTSKGSIKLGDMRTAATLERASKTFEEQEAPGSRSFFSEIVASVSDLHFAGDAGSGRYLVSRDYMSVKVWDVNMEKSPVATFKVHEHFRTKLCDLYENDAIFDKFGCAVSGCGNKVATGSYGSLFRVFDLQKQQELMLEASRQPLALYQKSPKQAKSPSRGSLRGRRSPGKGAGGPPDLASLNGQVAIDAAKCDVGSKMLHLAWHPTQDVIACANANALYMYANMPPRTDDRP